MERGMHTKIIKGFIPVVTTLLSAVIGYLFNVFFSDTRIFWIALVSLLFTATILLVIYLIFERKASQLDLLKIIEQSTKAEDWVEVIKLAHPISRPLLLSDRHILRVYLGWKVYKAASSCADSTVMINNKEISIAEIKASVLIDDVGWSFYKVDPEKNALSAKSNIISGISEAREITGKNKKYELILKALRHILAINREMGDVLAVNQSISNLQQELSSSEFKALSKQDQDKIIVGLDYDIGLCNVLFYEKSTQLDKDKFLKTALDYAEKCKHYYEKNNDTDRICKTYVLFGKIELVKNQVESVNKALNIFYDGIRLCSANIRRDYFAELSILYVEAIGKLIALNLPTESLIMEHITRAEEIRQDMKKENAAQEKVYNQRLKRVKRIKLDKRSVSDGNN
jgi:hypothetical protein